MKSKKEQIAKLGRTSEKTAPLSPNPGNDDNKTKTKSDKKQKPDNKESEVTIEQLELEVSSLQEELDQLEEENKLGTQEFDEKLSALYSELFESERLTRVPCFGRDRFYRSYYSVNGCLVVEETENPGFSKSQKNLKKLTKEELDPNFPSWFKTKSEYPANYAWLLDTKLEQSKLLEILLRF